MRIIKFHEEKISSTQDLAKSLKNQLTQNMFLLCTADEQTKGLGTKGKKWLSPKGNIYATLSFLLPKKHERFLFNIPQVVTYSIAQGLINLGLIPKIKWINDVLIDGKKVAGILCESCNNANKNAWEIHAGFGINIALSKENLETIDQPATSVALEIARSITSQEVLQNVEEFLYKNIAILQDNGFGVFKNDIEKLLIFKGEKIFFHPEKDGENYFKAILEGLDKEGALLLKIGEETKRFTNGKIYKKTI